MFTTRSEEQLRFFVAGGLVIFFDNMKISENFNFSILVTITPSSRRVTECKLASVERPRSASPRNPGSLDELKQAEKPSTVPTMKVKLPRQDSKSSVTRKPQPWESFASAALQSPRARKGQPTGQQGGKEGWVNCEELPSPPKPIRRYDSKESSSSSSTASASSGGSTASSASGSTKSSTKSSRSSSSSTPPPPSPPGGTGVKAKKPPVPAKKPGLPSRPQSSKPTVASKPMVTTKPTVASKPTSVTSKPTVASKPSFSGRASGTPPRPPPAASTAPKPLPTTSRPSSARPAIPAKPSQTTGPRAPAPITGVRPKVPPAPARTGATTSRQQQPPQRPPGKTESKK